MAFSYCIGNSHWLDQTTSFLRCRLLLHSSLQYTWQSILNFILRAWRELSCIKTWHMANLDHTHIHTQTGLLAVSKRYPYWIALYHSNRSCLLEIGLDVVAVLAIHAHLIQTIAFSNTPQFIYILFSGTTTKLCFAAWPRPNVVLVAVTAHQVDYEWENERCCQSVLYCLGSLWTLTLLVVYITSPRYGLAMLCIIGLVCVIPSILSLWLLSGWDCPNPSQYLKVVFWQSDWCSYALLLYCYFWNPT